MTGSIYIDQFSTDLTSWARFSADETMRFRLARSLVPGCPLLVDGNQVRGERRVVFLTDGGHPKHPLARGKHRIPADLAPVPWSGCYAE